MVVVVDFDVVVVVAVVVDNVDFDDFVVVFVLCYLFLSSSVLGK